MSLIRKRAPQFSATAWYNGSFKTIKLQDYLGKYLVLVFYPLDFTFVCPTQLISLSGMIQQFGQVECKIVACSIDSKYCHMQYTSKPRQQGGLGNIQLPLLSDINKTIAKDYGCLIEFGKDEGVSLRATYIIDKNGIIRHISINDLPVGRNFQQILRLVKAFEFTDDKSQEKRSHLNKTQKNWFLQKTLPKQTNFNGKNEQENQKICNKLFLS